MAKKKVPDFIKLDNDNDFQFIVLSAFRYAVGRRTYAVPLIQDWIRKHTMYLTEHTISVMVKDLDEIFLRCQRTGNYDELGSDHDRQTWGEFLKCMTLQNRVAATASTAKHQTLMEPVGMIEQGK